MSINIIQVGDVYRHFKNKFVVIDSLATHTETEEQMVVYHHLNEDNIRHWVRPGKMWFDDKVNAVGHTVKRFTKLDHIDIIDSNDRHCTMIEGDIYVRMTDGAEFAIHDLLTDGTDNYIICHSVGADKYTEIIMSENEMFKEIEDLNGRKTTLFANNFVPA